MTTESGRKLSCIVEGFLRWMEPCEAPTSFKTWAALGLVSGALERRVWTFGKGYKIHPNMFMLLIGPPGIGKSSVIDPIAALWGAMGTLNVISNASTRAAFIESIAGPPNPKRIMVAGKNVLCNPAVLPLSEFGTFFRENDIDLMNTLNAFYDAKDVPFTDKTVSRGSVIVDNPSLTIVGGTQPNYLHKILPEESFKMGFATRLVMTYESVISQGSLFSAGEQDPTLFGLLVHDLKQIGTLSGIFQFTNAAKVFFDNWYTSGQKPLPDHLRLQDYNTRRWASICKIAMCLSVSRGNSLVCDTPVLKEAMEMLFQAEATLPEAFKNMGGESDSSTLEEAFNYVWRTFATSKKPVREALLTSFISTKVPAHRVRAIIEVLLASGKVTQVGQGPAGLRLFTPQERSKHNEN